MIREAGQAQEKASGSLRRFGWVATTWVLLSAFFIVVFTSATIELVTLGPRFMHSILITWALAWLVAGLVTALIRRLNTKGRSTRKQNVMVFTTLLVLALGVVTTPFIEREIKERRNEEKAEAALKRYTLASHLGVGKEFDKQAVNQTLAELEDSYHRLRDIWPLHEDAGKIYVQLFRNLQSYHKETGNLGAAGHLHCTEYSPVISIPLEKAPSASTPDNFSRTPMHEMVHALMCQSLGREAFISIPVWFHEGMATRYHTEGFLRVMKRVEIRVATWLIRNDLTNTKAFCNQGPLRSDRKGMAIFYVTSLEFVNHLEDSFDLETLNSVVDDVREGKGFEESIYSRLGGGCEELYGQWRDSF